MYINMIAIISTRICCIPIQSWPFSSPSYCMSAYIITITPMNVVIVLIMLSNIHQLHRKSAPMVAIINTM